MLPLRTGAARIALSAEAEAGWRLHLRVVPVGLWYASQACRNADFTQAVEAWARELYTNPRYFHPAGYFVERGGSPAAAPTPDSALDAIAPSVARGERASVETTLRRTLNLRDLIRDYRDEGTPWPAAPGRDGAFVIELVAAAFAGRDRADGWARAGGHGD